MKPYLVQLVSVFSTVCFMSCSSNNNQQLKVQADDTALHVDRINNDTIISSYKYYFGSTLAEIRKQSWEKVIIDTVNDEFNKWIEAKLYYSSNEWIKVEAENIDKASVSSLETNTNYFLKDCPIKIGDEISTLILKDSAQFNFDEGRAVFGIGSYQVKAKCLDEIDDLEYDKILEAREIKKKELLPDKIKNCKVSSIRVLNMK